MLIEYDFLLCFQNKIYQTYNHTKDYFTDDLLRSRHNFTDFHFFIMSFIAVKLANFKGLTYRILLLSLVLLILKIVTSGRNVKFIDLLQLIIITVVSLGGIFFGILLKKILNRK